MKSVHIPRPSTTNEEEKPGVGFVFVAFDAVDSASKAAASLRARTFDGRKVGDASSTWFGGVFGSVVHLARAAFGGAGGLRLAVVTGFRLLDSKSTATPGKRRFSFHAPTVSRWSGYVLCPQRVYGLI